MKKPEDFQEIVHVEKLGLGQYRVISFDRRYAEAAGDLADALNEAVEQFDFGGELKTALGKEIKAWLPKAIAALNKAGYTE